MAEGMDKTPDLPEQEPGAEQAVVKKPWWKRCLWGLLHFVFVVVFWIFFVGIFAGILEEWKLGVLVGLLWINLPIGFTVYRSYRRTSYDWDWCFITFLCLYAEIVVCLLISGSWLPDIYFLRGLWFGFAFVMLVLAVGFILRLKKRGMSMPMFVYYLLGLISTGVVHVVTQYQWSLQ